MSQIVTAGLALAKTELQVHGADADGPAVLRKRLRRDQVPTFSSQLPRCRIAVEACGGAGFLDRKLG